MDRMKEAVVQLYVHIINFLARAKNWYEESNLRRRINTFSRPAELRYDDIIQEIEHSTAEIDHLSTAGARAEQRDMHLELRELSQRQIKFEGWAMEIRRLCIDMARSLRTDTTTNLISRNSNTEFKRFSRHESTAY